MSEDEELGFGRRKPRGTLNPSQPDERALVPPLNTSNLGREAPGQNVPSPGRGQNSQINIDQDQELSKRELEEKEVG